MSLLDPRLRVRQSMFVTVGIGGWCRSVSHLESMMVKIIVDDRQETSLTTAVMSTASRGR